MRAHRHQGAAAGRQQERVNFQLEDQEDGSIAIRFGLSAIKNVGEGAAESLIETRTEQGGAFTSIDDFCRNLDARNVNKRALESMAKAGAMDCITGGPDARLCWSTSTASSAWPRAPKLRESGQTTMFDLFGAEVATPLTGIDLESAGAATGDAGLGEGAAGSGSGNADPRGA